MTDSDRADRIRRRREQRSKPDQSDQTDQPDQKEQSDKTEQTDKEEQHSKTDKPTMKEQRAGTMMYIPQEQKSALDTLYKRLDLAYDEAYGVELEKNRHVYPLVVKHGIDGMGGVDGQTIKERLDDLDGVEPPTDSE